jgi:hypothetical protein
VAHKTIVVATVTAIIASAAYGQDRGAAPLVGAGAGGTGSSGSSNLNSNRGGLPPANSGSWTAPITADFVCAKMTRLKIRAPMQPLMGGLVAKGPRWACGPQASRYFVRSQMKRRML